MSSLLIQFMDSPKEGTTAPSALVGRTSLSAALTSSMELWR